MTCNILRPTPMTLREAKEAMGRSLEWPEAERREIARQRGYGIAQTERWLRDNKRDWDAAHSSADSIVDSDSPIFMCGDLVIPVCACGRGADLLCDYPAGGGKTCDLNLCEVCAFHVGEDLDLCTLHFAEWSASSGVQRVAPRLRRIK